MHSSYKANFWAIKSYFTTMQLVLLRFRDVGATNACMALSAVSTGPFDAQCKLRNQNKCIFSRGRMKAIVQRVASASVTVDGEVVSSIGRGLCVLVGIHRDDTKEQLEYVARKIVNLRVFDDEKGRNTAFAKLI
jgi:hypothetical protein